MKEIFTAGFPRSGNTWLGRCLSDLLSAPIQDAPTSPIKSQFAREIKGDFIIRKSHWDYRTWLRVKESDLTGEDAYVIFIQRDPRDVAVSMKFYYRMQNIGDAMAVMENSDYNNFIYEWVHGNPRIYVTYEQMHANLTHLLSDMYFYFTGEYLDSETANLITERQSFENHRKLNSHMQRKGIVGDWKNHFSRSEAKVFASIFNPAILENGYEIDPEWWKLDWSKI